MGKQTTSAFNHRVNHIISYAINIRTSIITCSKQNNYVGALMAGIDPTLQLNAETDDDITYEPAKDTLCLMMKAWDLER